MIALEVVVVRARLVNAWKALMRECSQCISRLVCVQQLIVEGADSMALLHSGWFGIATVWRRRSERPVLCVLLVVKRVGWRVDRCVSRTKAVLALVVMPSNGGNLTEMCAC